MAVIRDYTVTQTRKVHVSVVPEGDESYEQVALRKAQTAFENPGEPAEGMSLGVHGIPKITSTTIHRDELGSTPRQND